MKLSPKKKKSSKDERKVMMLDGIREFSITELTYRPMDLSLAKKYFPDLFQDYPEKSNKYRLKPKMR